ncbi:hypothetical protein ACFQI7_37485 [Paenibacillus allorhizosphaerae]|uniref:DUF4304 domain-containing protein n=1 Tax=Paenibacillus allorhizosphaerae TaxID=2849866 RepID=A0ABN7TXC6_9BACL|nr:hypothetical protein [Paenibacillus allorhizosphaerae]CAG7659143.1 hypothetical protein PAECIP111802_07408 [Paenibacillus allorhizosphaerae]
MSTSFDVYITSDKLPSYEALIDRANKILESKLHSIGIKRSFNFDISMRNKEGLIQFELSEPIEISDDNYLWVTVNDIDGGFCIYQHRNDQIYKDLWNDEFNRVQSRKFEDAIRTSLEKEFHWSVVRYMGTDPFYNLAYGFFASAFAELTNGIIFSDDNAWEYSKFPCLPDEFNKFYFNPDSTFEKDHQEWALRNIEHIIKELVE